MDIITNKKKNYEYRFYNNCITESINKYREKEEIEYYNGRYIRVKNINDICEKCGKKKHNNPLCNKTVFISGLDID